MEDRKGNINSLGFDGIVTILTRDRVIFQGEVIGREPNFGPDCFPQFNNSNRVAFLLVELRCFPVLLRDNAEIKAINPTIYQPNNTVRINMDQIVSIGPSGVCLDEECDTAS